MYNAEINVAGQVDEGWSDWLGGLEIQPTQAGETTLKGTITDQSALYGIIARLRDLGFKLNSIHVEAVNDLEY